MYGALMLSLATMTGAMGTLAIKDSAGFTIASPTVMGVFLYGASAYFMSLAMESMATGVVYAVWAGVSVATVAIVSMTRHGEAPEPATVVGVGLILAGVVTLGLFATGE